MMKRLRRGERLKLALGLLLCAGCSADVSPETNRMTGSAAAGDGAAGALDMSAAGSGTAADSGIATGQAGTGAAAGSGQLGLPPGTFEPSAELDPTAQFVWKESLPGQGTCKPGKYTGMFTCDYVPNGATMPQVTVSGPVALTLTKSMSGEFLEISDGTLDGVAQGVIGFSSTLAGKLDCSTLEFTAEAVKGIYGFGDPKLFPFGTFDGSLTGKLDTATLVLSGDWALTEGMGGVCAGPWSANYTP